MAGDQLDRARLWPRAALRWLIGLELNAEGNDQVPDNETITSDVSKGTIDMGLINHYYYYRLMAEIGKKAIKANIAYFAPAIRAMSRTSPERRS